MAKRITNAVSDNLEAVISNCVLSALYNPRYGKFSPYHFSDKETLYNIARDTAITAQEDYVPGLDGSVEKYVTECINEELLEHLKACALTSQKLS